ncbi:hypothetical protein FO470_11395 [Starkeya sp. 3C]|uniref:Uncharacterized protein n=1 Tax=Ancylobacter moscoviensis TaxID=2597768 RepID=A0ABY3DQX8_9HYPH|nr:hypothetical protein [Ancylobacter moscoviensis]TSJ62163.1 hypothetical protein FO470_11395 [Ancylobacter moscoviensis]
MTRNQHDGPHNGQPDGSEEFVTIVGGTAEEISRAFREQGLAEQDYAVVHRIGRHRFALPTGQDLLSLLDGRQLVAATYTRRAR